MAIKGIDIKETLPFSSEGDTVEPKTIFHIGNMPQSAKIELFGDAAGPDGSVSTKAIQVRAKEIFKLTVRKIENYTTKAQPEPFTVEKVTDDVVESIPFNVLMEVASKAVQFSFMDEETRKN